MRDPGHAVHHVPTAREIMTRSLITLREQDTVFAAIRVLLTSKISGAPVVDEGGALVGVLSELDCLRVLSAGEFYSDDRREAGLVRDYMSRDVQTTPPDADLYTLAQYFQTHAVRRLPVLEEGALIGQVSRRDVLRAMEELGERRLPHKHYPDYREPSTEVGARRTS